MLLEPSVIILAVGTGHTRCRTASWQFEVKEEYDDDRTAINLETVAKRDILTLIPKQ